MLFTKAISGTSSLTLAHILATISLSSLGGVRLNGAWTAVAVLCSPDDATTVSSVGDQHLLAIADVDHGLLPVSIRGGLGSPNEFIALLSGKDIVKNGGVKLLILWQRCLLEIDDGFPDLQSRRRLYEEVRGQIER